MDDKFREAASRYEALTVRIRDLEEKRNKLKQFIGKYVEKHGSQKVDGVNCYMATRTKITYDVEEIKKRFGKQAREFVSDRRDFDFVSFINVCKANGIDKSLFLNSKLCERKQEVDEKALSRLLDNGDVSLKDLQGCYTSEETSSFVIRIS